MAAKSEVAHRFPEHEKLTAVSKESNAQGAFLDWCLDEGIVKQGKEWRSIEKILAKYHDIDLDRIEVEKRNMIRDMRGQVDQVAGGGTWPEV